MRSRLRRLTARHPSWSFWLPELFASAAVITAAALVLAWILVEL